MLKSCDTFYSKAKTAKDELHSFTSIMISEDLQPTVSIQMINKHNKRSAAYHRCWDRHTLSLLQVTMYSHSNNHTSYCPSKILSVQNPWPSQPRELVTLTYCQNTDMKTDAFTANTYSSNSSAISLSPIFSSLISRTNCGYNIKRKRCTVAIQI